MKLTIYLIEDDPRFAKLLLQFLLNQSMFEVIGHAWTLAEARQFMAEKVPDVCLVDISLPDGNGIDLMREIRVKNAHTKIMVLSTLGHEKHIIASLEAGASGYLLKSEMPEQIVQSLIAVANDGGALGQHASKVLIEKITQTHDAPSHTPKMSSSHASLVSAEEIAMLRGQNHQAESVVSDILTPRALEIILAVKNGAPTKLVARQLDVSAFTVSQHLRSIYRKLGARNRMEAVNSARKIGII